MNSYKHALCLKNGYMTSGRIFCIKNKVYEYYISPGHSLEYNVKSETSPGYNHSMSCEFFDEYFLADWKPIKHVPLDEKLFEI